MDQIMSILTDQLGPFGPIIAVGVLGVVLVLATLPVLLKKRADPLAKLKAANQAGSAQTATQALRRSSSKDKLEKYSNFLEPQNADEYSAVQLKLLQAGYRTKNAVRMYNFAQFALGLTGLLIGSGLALYLVTNSDPSTQKLVIAVILPAAIGYMAPKYWVTKRLQERQQQIIDGFPDSLDMMLVCVEAGQSLDQSIVRVSKEIRPGCPPLADEYEMVAQEIKAGKDRVSVLRDMSERCGVPDVSSFVTVLIQSASFGTSIAEALRVYSSEMRDKRVMRAEEKANTLPTKMTLATMMLTVPPLLIIMIGPSVYEIYVTLSNANF